VRAGVGQSARTVVGVFQVAADRADLQQPVHQFPRRHAVSRLGVHGDRNRHHPGNPPGRGEHLLPRRALAVGVAEHRRDRGAGGGDRGESRFGHDLGAGRVPHVRQDEHLAGVVQLAEPVGVGLQVSGHRFLLSREVPLTNKTLQIGEK
jgi:hypothetical protein